MDYNIRHLGCGIKGNSEALKIFVIEKAELVFRISNIRDYAAGDKARAKFFGDGLDQWILSTR